MAGVLVFGEVVEGKLAAISTEALGIGRKLADSLGQELAAVIIGSGISKVANEAISFGADKVYVIDNEMFATYTNDGFVGALEKLNAEAAPEIIIMGQSSIGMDLSPRLAFRLGTATVLDCVDLTVEDGKLQKVKPVYGGNAQAVYVSETKPQMATIRAKAFEPLEPDTSRSGETINFDPGLDASAIRQKVIDRVKEEAEGIKLEDAEVVVCGGRGMGSAEAFDELYDLAKMLNGAVGASRPPCDSGWVPANLQIGLTGKMIGPSVYIGVALSGSSQHQSGMAGSKNIIAINKDPEANIFGIAHYGVVGDYKKVLPAFKEKCKDLLGK
ncbi:MAG: electron transfer flavoprotein subunit alpha/FixB family protein [Dehalococcoidia bacterium]